MAYVDENSEEFKKQVAFIKGIYIDWMQNLQKNAYAQRGIIHPEVIMQAFKELLEYYGILNEEVDYEELIRRLQEG